MGQAQQPAQQALSQTPAPGAPQAPAAQQALRVVVIDPAHGGTDAGAHGSNGVLESEVVLGFAQALRVELERQGWRVVFTRQANENPSFDDRSAIANGQSGAVFLSLHVASTGPVGLARAYYFAGPQTPEAKPPASPVAEKTAPAPAALGLLRWDQAQEPELALSRRLAELVQVQLAQKFRGSPEVPVGGAVRQLRTVAAPAVAVEISSVSVPDRKPLEQMAPALAEAVVRALAAFRPLYEAEAK